MTDTGFHQHPVFARAWSTLGPRAVAHRDRRDLLAGARGTVVEIGAGTGLNFPFYPDTVTSVLAVEPEPYLRHRAHDAAQDAPVPVSVVDGTAEAIPAEDARFDVAVACLVLCSVPSQAAALAELRRVLKPGGELRFYEHVVAEHPVGSAVQRTLDRTGVWPAVGAGCHLARDTGAAIRAAGFTTGTVGRAMSGPLPHIAGIAQRG